MGSPRRIGGAVFVLGEDGLPRRCAPRNDRVGGAACGYYGLPHRCAHRFAMTRLEVRRMRGVGEIGEAPPVAGEANRFRGSAPIGGHDSGRESAGTTVGNRRPLRGTGSAVRGVYGLPRRSADWFAMTFLEGRVICGARPAGGGGILCAGWGDLFSIYTQILFFACYN